MKYQKNTRTYLLIMIATFLGFISGQTTTIIKKTDIYQNLKNKKNIGVLFPGATIKKLKKDKTGNFILATLDFYIPISSLEETKIAKGVGESQSIDDVTITLLKANKEGNRIKFSVEITNHGEHNMDMSALLLFRVFGNENIPGKLDILNSKNSVGTIKPGMNLHSDLIYNFDEIPETVEIAFQSRLGGDKIFFIIRF